MSHYKESHYRQVFHCDTNMFKVSPIIMQTFYIKSKQNEKSEAKGMNRSSFSRLTGQISPGQCSAPSRPPGSPRSWWSCTCPCRRRRHMMFRDIDCIVLKQASLCLSCFTAEDASQLLCCWQSASASVSFAPIFYVCLPVCHSFLVCMRDGSPNISYFHRWKSNGMMRWWNDNDETVSSPTKVFGVSDHDGDRPV